MAFIYVVFNIVNEKLYIGKTTGSLRDRWAKHVESAKLGVKTHFHNAIRKYGADKFQIQEIATCDNPDQMERVWIIALMAHESFGGYNQTWGGEGGSAHAGHKHSEETKRLISEKKKGFKPSRESVERVAAQLRGKPKSREHMQKVIETRRRLGIRPSEEQKRQHSQFMTGRFIGEKNPMYGVKLTGKLNGFYGRKHSEATKEHWREIRKGQKPSEETRKKQSEAHLKRWAAQKKLEKLRPVNR